jgi:hypothetical protein
MGKASSSKKVARAAKASGRPGTKKNYAWPAAIGAVVILGVVLVVLSFGGGADKGQSPHLTDHWHEAYGIYKCGAYLPNLPEEVNSGIHTHGDGLIHVEPTSSAETGKGANIANFVKGYNSLSISQSEIKLPDGQVFKDGGKCGDKTANVKIFHWAAGSGKPVLVKTATKDMLIKNGSAVSFAFVPDGVTPPLPSSVANLENPNAGEGSSQTTTTVATGGAPTTVPAAGGASTTAPAAGGSSTSAPAPAPTTTAAP